MAKEINGGCAELGLVDVDLDAVVLKARENLLEVETMCVGIRDGDEYVVDVGEAELDRDRVALRP